MLVFLENNARSNPVSSCHLLGGDKEQTSSGLNLSLVLATQGTLYYVIHDKLETVPGKLAGIIGYMSSSALNLVTEIGFVCMSVASSSLDEEVPMLILFPLPSISLPHAQRTHVLTHSVSLLLDNAFNLPAQSGLGLRRVQWQSEHSLDSSLSLPSLQSLS